jgi:putative membrane protein
MEGIVSQRKSIWKGTVAGLAGGLAASWVMNEFQVGCSAAAKKLKQNGNSSKSNHQKSEESEDATMKTAGKISETVLNRPLTKEQKKKGGPVVYYAFGAAMGALYGAMAERVPEVKYGFGLPFGAALFVGADEIAVPALGLARSPLETKPRDHLYGLVSHFVYGTTTELVRRGIRNYL